MAVLPDDDEASESFPEPLARSFKEESTYLSDLSDDQRACLSDLRSRVHDDETLASASIWGIPLVKDGRTDVVLLKFLRSMDFNVGEAFALLRDTVDWRDRFGIDRLLSEEEEEQGYGLEKAVFMHGRDRSGHPVCYNVYREFQNKEVYEKAFGDEEKRLRFLRWRVLFLERSIRRLDFLPGGVSTIFQVNDLKNSPGLGKKELRIVMELALNVLQDNYPEVVAKQLFINVPWWYLACYAMICPFLTQRARSKLVFAIPAKTPKVIFKYISPEQVPIRYGGLSVDCCSCDPEFSVNDSATDMTVKPGTKQIVEMTVNEGCILVWQIRVVGWEVRYGAEFVPDAVGGCTVTIQKPEKMSPNDEPVVQSSYNASKLGKVLLMIDNPTSKKKKLLYRFKVRPFPRIFYPMDVCSNISDETCQGSDSSALIYV